MSVPNLTMERDGNPLGVLAFEPRPMGSTGAAIPVTVWNDKPVSVANESVGTGDGVKAVFSLAHGNVLAGTYQVLVDGVTKAEPGDYSINRVTGAITFVSGAIPASGKAVVASYIYGTGAGFAENVWLVARRRAVDSGDGAKTEFQTPTPILAVYEVLVDNAVVTGWTQGAAAITFASAPAAGAVVEIWYEDDGIAAGAVQVRSSGVVDPHNRGIVDDAAVSSVSVGGSDEITDEAVGQGDGGSTVFPVGHPPMVFRSVSAKVDGVATPCTAHPLSGEVEFETPPAAGKAILVSYRRLRAARLGAIPPNCGRTVILRGRAPSVSPASGVQGIFAVEGI